MTQQRSEQSEESWDISPERKHQQKRSPKRKSPSPPTKNSANTTPHASITAITLPIPQSLSPPPADSPMAAPIRLLVCSLGNPAPYQNTLHSAGHIVLSSLQQTLGLPAFRKSRLHSNGLLATPSPDHHPPYTLWQSPTLMNVSGPAVSKAWAQFLRDLPGDCGGRLVVIHDELELGLGQVKLKKGEASPKGHNGLKSCKEQLRGVEWWRVGVGIGRPVSREPDVVAGYVLRAMSGKEREGLLGATGRVEAVLRGLCSG